MKIALLLLTILVLSQSSKLSSKILAKARSGQQQLSEEDRQYMEQESNRLTEQANFLENMVYNWESVMQQLNSDFQSFDTNQNGSIDQWEGYDFFNSLQQQYSFLQSFGPIDYQQILWSADYNGNSELEFNEISQLFRSVIVSQILATGQSRGQIDFYLQNLQISLEGLDMQGAYDQLSLMYEQLNQIDSNLWGQYYLLQYPQDLKPIVDNAFANNDWNQDNVIDDNERHGVVDQLCLDTYISDKCSQWDFDTLYYEKDNGDNQMSWEEFQNFVELFVFKSLARSIGQLSQEESKFWNNIYILDGFIYQLQQEQTQESNNEGCNCQECQDSTTSDSDAITNWDDYQKGWDEGYEWGFTDGQNSVSGYQLMQISSKKIQNAQENSFKNNSEFQKQKNAKKSQEVRQKNDRSHLRRNNQRSKKL